MFFDNRYLYDLLDRAEKKGITIPILPGIMPLTDIRKIRRFASLKTEGADKNCPFCRVYLNLLPVRRSQASCLLLMASIPPPARRLIRASIPHSFSEGTDTCCCSAPAPARMAVSH